MGRLIGIMCLAAGLFVVGGLPARAQWKVASGRLMTRWSKQVSPDHVHPEYPRPQLVREVWLNLNGLWQYAIRPKAVGKPDQWDGEILVPFPAESALSGVMQAVGPENRLWYRREFSLPGPESDTGAAWAGKRILLHFGAVDWRTTVWVNGHEVASHAGGYDPFSCDISDALRRQGPQELIVAVFDPSDAGFQPRGKQVADPHGIWYTPTTGIWQTVWLEPVPKSYIRRLKLTPDITAGTITVEPEIAGESSGVEWYASAGSADTAAAQFHAAGTRGTYFISKRAQDRWTPDNPVLHPLRVHLKTRGTETMADSVASYFGLREVAIGPDEQGVNRILLNGQPLFQFGPLDQGFWPDGLYTAPSDEALKYDIEVTRRLGFNMIRKHVKVEPDRWYYHCDRLGMLVWQDMPSGDQSAAWDPFGKHDGTEMTRSRESADNYNREWQAIIDALHSHPCIVMWVPFNEGWGQANTVAVSRWTKRHDPTRLVNCASGGNDFPVGDVIDVHRYPGPFAPQPTAERVAVLGEFGGLGLPLEGHTWQSKDNWGYRSFATQQELQRAYLGLLSVLRPMVARGVSAAVYTQTTDVEVEVNGLMSYDREILKIDAAAMAQAARPLYLPPPVGTTLVPTSEAKPQAWRYATEQPGTGWQNPEFDDARWKSGDGGFGAADTPGAVVRTAWETGDIWLRRTFALQNDQLAAARDVLALRIHHDEDAEVFLNGQPLARVSGYTTQYVDIELDDAAARLLRTGSNTLAVHCHQTEGGQYVDVGLVRLRPQQP